jgi:hypothetical protein
MIDIDKILTDYGIKLTEQLVTDIKQKQVTKYGSVNASGKLANSIKFKVANSVLTITGEQYIGALQFGRKPTERKGDKPLKEIIYQWIEDKPSAQMRFGWSGLKEYQKKGLAYVIARKIHKEGTTIYQQGGTDLVSSIFNEALQRSIEKEFADLLITEINLNILELGKVLA